MTTMTGGDLLIETLAREGIQHVFSIPGGQLLSAYDAIREHPSMDMISPRHEGASALMAGGYALASGGPGVVMSTVGAGVIYEAGGLLLAWRERLPVVSISPQVQSYRMKPIQESLQACDQDEIFRPFTKFRAIIYHYNRIPQLVRRALKVACAPERGPVHLDVPVDVLFDFKRVSASLENKLFPRGFFRFEGEVVPDEKSLDRAAKLIHSSKRPLVLAGRGVDRARAGEYLSRLLAAGSLPALTSIPAFGCLSAGYENRLGQVEWWDQEEAIEAAAGSDLLLLFEADEATSRFAQKIAGKNPGIKVIQSAEHAASIGSVVPVEVGLVGTAPSTLMELGPRVEAKGSPSGRDEDWIARLVSFRDRLSQKLFSRLGPGPRLQGVISTLEVVGRLLRPQDVVVCDGPMAAGAGLVRLSHPGLHGAVMIADDDIPGAGLPLALGIKAARPGSRVFLVTETGRLKRHSREFQTARRYGLSVTTFLFQEMERRPDEEVDFAALARSYGVNASSVIEPAEEITEETIKEGMASETGMLFDASQEKSP